jgi:hypothetical protein
MKKLVLLLAALICLQGMAFAVPDSVTTGPFKISFDLGVPKANYTITVSDPATKEALDGEVSTNYEFMIRNKIGMTQLADISITYRPNTAILPSDSDLETIANLGMSQVAGATNIETAVRPIDGTHGGVSSCDYISSIGSVKMYGVSYYPTLEAGHTQVVISSSYPWESETLQLLRSIHVERIQGSAESGSKSYVGPTSSYAGSGLGAKSGQEEKNILSKP